MKKVVKAYPAQQKRRKLIWLVLALTLFTGLALLLLLTWRRPLASPSVANQSNQTTPAPDPLTIEAIRARNYHGSQITFERQSDNVFSRAVVSYYSDRLKLFALRATPSGTTPGGGWPVIILAHGYLPPDTYSTDGPEYEQFISSLTSAGFAVYKPDYRGHGKSEGQPEGGHFSPVYAYDVLNLITSLKLSATNEQINPNRIGLLGHSLGGHVSLRTAVVSPDVKATALLAGVVGSFDDIFYNWPNSPMPLDRPANLILSKKRALINKYGEPKDNPGFWNSASAINYVQSIVGPVQIHHDIDDPMVPLLFSEHLDQKLTEAGKQHEFFTYPGSDHQFILSRSLVLQRLITFFKSNL